METNTVVKFEFGEENILYVPSEHRFEVLVEQAFESALSNRTIVLSDDVKDTMTTVFGEQLMTVQEAYSRRPGAVAVGFSFTADVWTERAVELNVMGGVPWKAANVAALKERGSDMSNTDIADALDIDKSTVSRHVDTVTRVVDQAEWVSENMDL